MSKLGERVLQRLKETGISQADLARRVGVTQPAINHLIKRGTGGSAHLHKIARELGTTPEYLLGETDNPNPSKSKEEQLPFKGAVQIEAADGPLTDDLVEIDEIDLRFGLGGTFLDNPVETERRVFSRSWLRHFTDAPPHLLTWTIGEGDSMEPTIRSGEMILIDRSQTDPKMGDEIWAFAFGEIGMVKRLRPRPDGTVDIHSDNPVVRPDKATDGELYVIGRVVAVVRRL